MHNTVGYAEIQSQDPAVSEAFFGSVFGWEFRREMGPDYVSFRTPAGTGGLTGGFGRGPSAPPQAQLLYISVADIDAALALVEAHGGRTLRGRTLISPEYGHYAHFADPHGVLWGLTQHPKPAPRRNPRDNSAGEPEQK